MRLAALTRRNSTQGAGRSRYRGVGFEDERDRKDGRTRRCGHRVNPRRPRTTIADAFPREHGNFLPEVAPATILVSLSRCYVE